MVPQHVASLDLIVLCIQGVSEHTFSISDGQQIHKQQHRCSRTQTASRICTTDFHQFTDIVSWLLLKCACYSCVHVSFRVGYDPAFHHPALQEFWMSRSDWSESSFKDKWEASSDVSCTFHTPESKWALKQSVNLQPAVETALEETIAAYGSFSSSCVCLQSAEQHRKALLWRLF